MDIKTVAEAVAEKHPAISAYAAAVAIRAAFEQIRAELADIEEGVVSVKPLGELHVSQVRKSPKDEGALVKRVVLRVAKKTAAKQA